MAQWALEHHVQDLERSIATVEQILPTLATKADLADLKTATKADIQLAEEGTRRHFDVVAESLRDDIRMIADGVVSLHARVDAHRAETAGVLANHERRLTRLETPRPKRR